MGVAPLRYLFFLCFFSPTFADCTFNTIQKKKKEKKKNDGYLNFGILIWFQISFKKKEKKKEKNNKKRR